MGVGCHHDCDEHFSSSFSPFLCSSFLVLFIFSSFFVLLSLFCSFSPLSLFLIPCFVHFFLFCSPFSHFVHVFPFLGSSFPISFIFPLSLFSYPSFVHFFLCSFLFFLVSFFFAFLIIVPFCVPFPHFYLRVYSTLVYFCARSRPPLDAFVDVELRA